MISSLSKVQVLHSTGWDWHWTDSDHLELASASFNTVEAVNDSDADGLMSLGRRNMVFLV